MATLIDALVVSLTIDASGAKKGAREAGDAQRKVRDDAVRTQKAYEESGRRIAESINSARNAAIGLFGAMTAGRGINNLVTESTQASAALGRMARDLNISTEALSAYEGMSRQVGNTAGQVTSALEATQNQIQQFRLLGAAMPSLPIFRSLGISLADARGNARSTTDIYNDVLNALHRRPAQERATLAAGLGYGQETVNLAALPAERRNQMLADARRDSPGRASTDAAARREAAWVRLDRVIMRVTDQILLAMTPTIEFVVEQLSRLASFLGEHALSAFTAIEGAVRRFAGYIGSQDFQDDMAAFVEAVREAGAGLLELARWLGLVSRPVDPDDQRNFIRGPDGTMNWVAGPNGEPVARLNPNAGNGRGTGLTGGTGATGAPTGADAAAREREAFDFFRSRGYSAEQAAGIVANIRQESNFRHDLSHETDGRGFGIVGWNNDGQQPGRDGRLTRLGQHVARLRGQAAPASQDAAATLARTATWQEQLQFADHELSAQGDERAAGRRIREATTANEAAREGVGWLRPARGVLERARRGNMADDALRRLTAPATPAAPPSSEAAAAALGVRVPRPVSPTEAAAAALGVRVGPPPTPDPGLVPGPAGAALRDNVRPNQTSSNETSIGAVHVVTQATDAGGIARDIGAALRRTTFVDQATTGLA